jgi:AcrR family transcriptional regulator
VTGFGADTEDTNDEAPRGRRSYGRTPHVRKAPAETRRAIRCAALAAFRRHGYRSTTLQEIAGEVGLTRGAVLHHFNSKADLLAAVVDPYLQVLDGVLDAADVSDPPTAAQRERLLRQLAGLMLENRETVALLTGDVAARAQVDSTDAWNARTLRLTTLLTGTHASETEHIRTTAALGAILHPAASAWLDLDGADARAALVDASLAAIGSPSPDHQPAAATVKDWN